MCFSLFISFSLITCNVWPPSPSPHPPPSAPSPPPPFNPSSLSSPSPSHLFIRCNYVALVLIFSVFAFFSEHAWHCSSGSLSRHKAVPVRTKTTKLLLGKCVFSMLIFICFNNMLVMWPPATLGAPPPPALPHFFSDVHSWILLHYVAFVLIISGFTFFRSIHWALAM